MKNTITSIILEIIIAILFVSPWLIRTICSFLTADVVISSRVVLIFSAFALFLGITFLCVIVYKERWKSFKNPPWLLILFMLLLYIRLAYDTFILASPNLANFDAIPNEYAKPGFIIILNSFVRNPVPMLILWLLLPRCSPQHLFRLSYILIFVTCIVGIFLSLNFSFENYTLNYLKTQNTYWAGVSVPTAGAFLILTIFWLWHYKKCHLIVFLLLITLGCICLTLTMQRTPIFAFIPTFIFLCYFGKIYQNKKFVFAISYLVLILTICFLHFSYHIIFRTQREVKAMLQINQEQNITNQVQTDNKIENQIILKTIQIDNKVENQIALKTTQIDNKVENQITPTITQLDSKIANQFEPGTIQIFGKKIILVSRLSVWCNAFNAFLQSPILGAPIHHDMNSHVFDRSTGKWKIKLRHKINIFNGPLEAFVITGILGGCLFLFFIYRGFCISVDILKNKPEYALFALFFVYYFFVSLNNTTLYDIGRLWWSLAALCTIASNIPVQTNSIPCKENN
jgi:hypothetical protein